MWRISYNNIVQILELFLVVGLSIITLHNNVHITIVDMRMIRACRMDSQLVIEILASDFMKDGCISEASSSLQVSQQFVGMKIWA